jgi:hypothetical protein
MRILVLAPIALSLSTIALVRPNRSDAATVRHQPHANTEAAPQNCASPESHQFDFWIGDWVVTDSAGKTVLGTEHNVAVLGGCAIQENWHGSDGSEGTSLNAYIVTPKQWHQSWIAANGNLLLLDGAFAGGKMVLQGASTSPKGPIVNRITWTPLAPDRVRQTWDISTDGGKTWVHSFDGYYKRKTS